MLDHVTDGDFLKFLKFCDLTNRRLYLMHYFSFLFIQVELLPAILFITSIRILPRNFGNSSLFTATSKISPSAGCVSAANHLCKLGNPLLHENIFCANPCVRIKLSIAFFSGFRAFVLVLLRSFFRV